MASRLCDCRAVGTLAAAVGMDLAFERLSGSNPSVSLFLCAIAFVAWIKRYRPSLVRIHPDHLVAFAFQFEGPKQLALFALAPFFEVALSATRGRWGAREAHRWPARRELARLVRRVHRPGASRRAAAVMSRVGGNGRSNFACGRHRSSACYALNAPTAFCSVRYEDFPFRNLYGEAFNCRTS